MQGKHRRTNYNAPQEVLDMLTMDPENPVVHQTKGKHRGPLTDAEMAPGNIDRGHARSDPRPDADREVN